MEEKKTNGPEWHRIFRCLEHWRRKKLSLAGEEDTAVTAVAGEQEKEGSSKPWAVLVSTIISLRTLDSVTREASRRLLEKAPVPEELIALGSQECARLIYPAGFYRTKAENLVKISRLLLDQHAGLVPADMEKLLSLPGVGRKTANLVLTEAFGLAGICVDIHVHRISNRLGWVAAPSPDKTEAALRAALPSRYWLRINGLFVLYGQNICRPLAPFCSRCVIYRHCQRVGVTRSR